MAQTEEHSVSVWRLLKRQPMALLWVLGPGLVAGASDIDPTTVATLAVIGSTTTFGLAWLMVLVIPMLVVVQVIGAAIGAVCKTGLEDVIRTHYGMAGGLLALFLVLGVNIITLGADLEGGGAALSLLTGWPYQWFIIPFAAIVGGLLVIGSYNAVQRVLRYVLLVFLAYIAAAFLAHPNWGQVLHDTLVPHLSFSSNYISGALALLGTTLTSYAYVWETIETAQERPPLHRLGLVQLDAGLGMVAAGIICYFIVVATGATLGVHHKTVQTAQDAAAALAPVAGQMASVVFGIGLLASAVLAVPVLAGTSAYVMAEAFGWRGDLDARFSHAPAFYVALLLSLTAGVGITLAGVSPIQLLFFSSLAAGLATPVTLAFMMLAARNPNAMGKHRVGRGLAIAGWLVTLVVSAASLIYLLQQVFPNGL
ncbi:MAG: putative transporter-NRAMP family [Chloroflexi bacterium]|nr:putative transporter-NRAMP family [Chloroflexota bacterium]